MSLNLYEGIEEFDMRVDCLLHDAEHKDAGAMMARAMGDLTAVDRLLTDRDLLVAEALCIDPDKKSPTWKESSL